MIMILKYDNVTGTKINQVILEYDNVTGTKINHVRDQCSFYESN